MATNDPNKPDNVTYIDPGNKAPEGKDAPDLPQEAGGEAIEGTGTSTGGIVGSNNTADAKLSDCENHGTVTGKNSTGGIAGVNNGLLQNSKNTVEVKGTGINLGGIVGQNNGATTAKILDCANTGPVTQTGTSEATGGVAGNNIGRIERSYNTAPVTGAGKTGGVAGNGNASSIILQSYNTGAVVGTTDVGGVLGYMYNLTVTIKNCYATGNVTGTTNVGGVLGSGLGDVINWYHANGIIKGTSLFGGAVGIRATGTKNISYVVALATTLDNATANSTGFFSGTVNPGGTLTNCFYNSEMTHTTATPHNSMARVTGVPLSTAQSASWWKTTVGGDYADTAIWTINDGALPKLTGVTP